MFSLPESQMSMIPIFFATLPAMICWLILLSLLIKLRCPKCAKHLIKTSVVSCLSSIIQWKSLLRYGKYSNKQHNFKTLWKSYPEYHDLLSPFLNLKPKGEGERSSMGSHLTQFQSEISFKQKAKCSLKYLRKLSNPTVFLKRKDCLI